MPSARFTPSLLDGETLEELFVHRHHLVEDCLARIERAALSDERGARLLVGPRGAGKTHLISLVHHRALALDGFGTQFQLAWLPEDLWTVGSFDDLAGEIVRALEPAIESGNASPVETIVASSRAIGPIVVLIENLDQVFDEIGLDGQRQLRQLMENERSLLLIATSTRLGSSVLDQAQPFYGFFDTTPLDPFDVGQAAEMLKQIALHDGDTKLAAELETPTARRRLAAVAHLAGGQPRVWALLAAGLTIERLDDLVDALIDRFDDLTPYYQERLARLSVNERKVVRYLSDSDRSSNVRQIAEATGIEQRSLATTIGDLREKGWVRQRRGPLVDAADGRLRYYDLAEPLARLAFQLKESRGRPVRLVVDFLKTWFDADVLGGFTPDGHKADPYIDQAQRAERIVDRTMEFCNALRIPRWSGTEQEIDPDGALSDLLIRIDDGLAELSLGEPGLLLGESPAITSLLDERLLSGRSIGRIRVELAELAAKLGPAAEWIPRVEAMIPSADAETKYYTELTLLELLAGCGRFQQAETLTAELRRRGHIEADAEQLGRIQHQFQTIIQVLDQAASAGQHRSYALNAFEQFPPSIAAAACSGTAASMVSSGDLTNAVELLRTALDSAISSTGQASPSAWSLRNELADVEALIE